MGGDFGPCVTVPAALQALASHSQLVLLLVGDPDIISSFLAKADSSLLGRVQVIPAESVIASDAKPSQAIRNSRGSSMRVALELVKEGKAQACVSAGNTGALMGLAKLLLKPLDGIERPALMTVLPHQQHGKTVVLDLGANVDSDSEMLVQFAVMGAVMAEEVLEISQPRVALLNIGSEDQKGTDEIRDAAAVLRGQTHLPLTFTGFVEGNQLARGNHDVIVCDGFAGNIALKTAEGTARFVADLLKRAFRSSVRSKVGFLISRPATELLRDHLDPNNHNGAVFLGLNGIVVKSHGSANERGVATAIGNAAKMVRADLTRRIADDLGNFEKKAVHA